MSRAHVDEFYTAYLEGSLPESARREMDAHLRSCPQCAAGLAELRQLVADLQQLSLQPVPPDFTAGVRARLPARRHGWGWRWPLFAGGLAAATVLVMLALHLLPGTAPRVHPFAPSLVANVPHQSEKPARIADGRVNETKTPAPSAAPQPEKPAPAARQPVSKLDPFAGAPVSTPSSAPTSIARVPALPPSAMTAPTVPNAPATSAPVLAAIRPANEPAAPAATPAVAGKAASLPPTAVHVEYANRTEMSPPTAPAAPQSFGALSATHAGAGGREVASRTNDLPATTIPPLTDHERQADRQQEFANAAPTAQPASTSASEFHNGNKLQLKMVDKSKANAGVIVSAVPAGQAGNADAVGAGAPEAPNEQAGVKAGENNQPTLAAAPADNHRYIAAAAPKAMPATRSMAAQRANTAAPLQVEALHLPGALGGPVWLKVAGNSATELTVTFLLPAGHPDKLINLPPGGSAPLQLPPLPDGAAIRLTLNSGATRNVYDLLVPGTKRKAAVNVEVDKETARIPLLQLATAAGIFILCPRDFSESVVTFSIDHATPLNAINALAGQQHWQTVLNRNVLTIVP